jgi:hypothetical protein
MEEVENFLKKIELEKYLKNFEENEITSMEKLTFITKDFLNQIGVKNLSERNILLYYLKNDGTLLF